MTKDADALRLWRNCINAQKSQYIFVLLSCLLILTPAVHRAEFLGFQFSASSNTELELSPES